MARIHTRKCNCGEAALILKTLRTRVDEHYRLHHGCRGYRSMTIARKIEVLFIAGFGPIVRETTTSRRLYSNALGIRFKEESGGYLHTEALQGAKTFALWPLPHAAHSCFGKDSWPDDIPVPQAWL